VIGERVGPPRPPNVDAVVVNPLDCVYGLELGDSGGGQVDVGEVGNGPLRRNT
jgi:hypothetical protein